MPAPRTYAVFVPVSGRLPDVVPSTVLLGDGLAGTVGPVEVGDGDVLGDGEPGLDGELGAAVGLEEDVLGDGAGAVGVDADELGDGGAQCGVDEITAWGHGLAGAQPVPYTSQWIGGVTTVVAGTVAVTASAPILTSSTDRSPVPMDARTWRRSVVAEPDTEVDVMFLVRLPRDSRTARRVEIGSAGRGSEPSSEATAPAETVTDMSACALSSVVCDPSGSVTSNTGAW